ncbi:MAG: hypothetical protein Q9187_002831 [Circinaria calcarea]
MEGLSPEEKSSAARGHKANLSNPNTSEESKAHSREVLESLGGEDAYYGKAEQNADKDPNRVAGGLKATISNPGISEEAKENAKERLEEMGK